MAEHQHLEPRRFRIDVELGLVVPKVDRDRAELHDLVLGYRPGPVAAVVVAAHRRDGRDAPQLLQHFRPVDVPGMEDMAASFQSRDRLIAHQAVRVGDEADAKEFRGSQKGG